MIICHYDETNTQGGLEKQTRLLSRELRRRGEPVVVLGSTRSLSHARWRLDDGVPVRLFWTYASPQVSGRFFPAAVVWALQLLLWLFANRRKVELIHCHQIRIHAFVAAICTKLFGIPSILKSATGGEGADIRAIASRKYFGKAGRSFLIRHTSIFVATTNSIADDLLACGVNREKISTIPNGLVVPTILDASSESRRVGRCVFLGRLSPDKNILSLASAANSKLFELGLTLDIFGKGSDEAELVEFIDLQRAREIRFAGFIEEPSQILPRYGWLLLPSDAEGLSNAMLEAMANGVVPVATKVSGCVDHIVEGISGYFFNGVDAESIVAGLKQIASTSDDKWLEMSSYVRSYAASAFGIDVIADRYVELYREIRVNREPV